MENLSINQSHLNRPRSFTNVVAEDNLLEEGNIAASSSHSTARELLGTQPTVNYRTSEIAQRQHERWLMNYQEAAIYLDEGENNEKFDTHPKSQTALPSYLIAHHSFFHVIDSLAALLLLSLAVIEKPAVYHLNIPIEVHASLEILGISILALDLIFRARWQGIKVFFRHIRSLMKCVLLLVMLVEAVTVAIRQSNHFRVTRALRPLFLLDTYYCKGIRRFVRQLLLSLPPIMELLVLLLFVMLLFSILGFYLFSPNINDPFFATIQDSFISLFVLLTTANYPDVMMPAYSQSSFAAIFFIIYITIELYFIMNLFLAVVYDTFTTLEKQKVRKLLLHQRKACQHAFRLLVSRKHPKSISLRHFTGLVKFFRPRKRKEEVFLMFKTLNTSKTGGLSLEEFYNVYSIANLSWRKLPYRLNRVMTGLHKLVKTKWFEYGIYVVILGNFSSILYEAILASVQHSAIPPVNPNCTHAANGSAGNCTEPLPPALKNMMHATWHSIMFTCIYTMEAILKILGLGPKAYFTDGWNLFDLAVTLVGAAGLFGDLFKDGFFFFVVLRPFRLVRIFKARKRYRDVLGTLFILADRLGSLVATLVLLYYFYAIIGMECFGQIDMTDCCKENPSIAAYYANGTGYYQLNNFEDIFKSGVTLFELTVVNNWFIIMEGYASAASGWSRIYFMTFYILTMVVMTVVVAFILEAFMFKIQYRRQTCENSSIDYLVHHQTLCLEEIYMINNVKMCMWTGETIAHLQNDELSPGDSCFIGQKKRGKIELSIQMYADEIAEWLAEDSSMQGDSQPAESVPDIVATVSDTLPAVSSINDLPFYMRPETDPDDSQDGQYEETASTSDQNMPLII